MSDYLQFLRSKIVTAPSSGFRVDPSEINPALKPHQRDGVVWALAGGYLQEYERSREETNFSLFDLIGGAG